MSRILYVWELGGGYGHVSGFLPLACELRRRGHEIVCAVKDLRSANAVLGRHGIQTHQAPIWLRETSGIPAPVNYSELLFRTGFLNEQALMGMVRGWLGLFTRVDPDLLLVDHAPIALLAARGGIRGTRAILGTGFYSPPRRQPLPSFCPWLNVQIDRLAESDRRVLEVVNRVVHRLGGEPLVGMADLFRADEDFLCTFPELDHYTSREPARYWGPTFAASEGVLPEWPDGRGTKIFAYVSPTYRDFETLLKTLAELPHRALVYAPGVDHVAALRRVRYRNIAFSEQPVQMTRALEECDLVISHGGHGTVALALLAGRPLLLLPIYVEQVLTSRTVTRYGAAKMVNPDSRNPSYARLVTEVLRDATYAERARAFAREHSDFQQSSQLEALVGRCEQLVG